MDYSGSGDRWYGLYNPPEGKDYTWYISGIFPANWVIIYYRSHPLQESEQVKLSL